MSAVIAAEDLAVHFGGVVAVDGVSLAVEPGRILSIIGPNGAGKTTLFNLLSGVYRPTRGRVLLQGEDVTALSPDKLSRAGLSRTFQNLQVFFRMTALENVMVGRHQHERTSIVSHFLALPSVRRENARSRDEARRLLTEVGLSQWENARASSMPYGALKRLEIARALAAQPKVLMLDEPAAGCNAVETAEIDEVIVKVAAAGVAVLLVEHDMNLVMKISDRILVLESGRYLIEGDPRTVRNDPRVMQAYLGVQEGQEANKCSA